MSLLSAHTISVQSVCGRLQFCLTRDVDGRRPPPRCVSLSPGGLLSALSRLVGGCRFFAGPHGSRGAGRGHPFCVRNPGVEE